MTETDSINITDRNACAARAARFVIITGVSGAGKSYAIKCLEDIGFFCVDNMPATLIPIFADLCLQNGDRISNVALVVDIRERDFLDNITGSLSELRVKGVEYDILFLDATDEALLRRFSETRRKHPLGEGVGVLEGLQEERKRVAFLRDSARRVVDTSGMTPGELRDVLFSIFAKPDREPQLLTTVVSFGYKFGLPIDSDVVLDVRFLPNPHYVNELRAYTGNDKKVVGFLETCDVTVEFLDHLRSFLGFLLPRFKKEGKSYLTIAVGCTGGRHRSVYVANRIAEMLERQGADVRVQHRDIGR